MKNGKKLILRIAVAVMCAAMAVSTLPAAVFAEGDTPDTSMEDTKATGVCGGITWTIENDTLTISPAENPDEGYDKGVMKSFCTATDEETGTGSFTSYPWYNKTFTKIVVADGVTSIAAKAFITNGNVTEVTIGKDVSEINAGAFAQLAACTGFTVADGNKNFTAVDGVLYSNDMSKLYYYPIAKEGTAFEIPGSVTMVGYNAIFRTKLTSITFEKSNLPLTLGFGCLAKNTVSEIDLPARVSKICNAIFADWTKDQTVWCANESIYNMISQTGVKCQLMVRGRDYVCEKDGYTFLCGNDGAVITNYTGHEEKLDIPETVEVDGKTFTVVGIGDGAFGIADGQTRYVKEITIPATVTSISNEAFRGYNAQDRENSLEKVTILGNTVTVGGYAFARNPDLILDMSNVETLNATEDTYHSHFNAAKEIYVKNEAMAEKVLDFIGPNTKVYIAPKNEAYSPYWSVTSSVASDGKPIFKRRIPETKTLTFNYADGSSDKVVKVRPDGTYPLSEETAPTRTGYTFEGWYNGDTKVEDKDLTFGTVGKDITLTAKWTANPYTIKFDANGGTGTIKDQGATYDADVTLPENTFTNGDKIFIGWATSADGQVVYADKATVKNLTADREVTLYAVWAVKSVPINPATPVIPSEPTVTPSVSNGWKDVSQGTVYYKNGVKVKGWQKIDGETYYFDQKGVLQTGWLNLDGHWYRLDNTGAMQTGWVKVGKAWYFMDENGVMDAATWLSDGGKWYYFGADGAMYSNKWRCTKGVWYYLLGNGEMAKNCWIEDKGNWYYLGADGGMLVDTTTPDGYRVDENGVWIKK